MMTTTDTPTRLGHASSQYGNKPRWTEISIYEHVDDEGEAYYVIAGVGKSVMYHRPGCSSLTTEGLEAEAHRGGIGCGECSPVKGDEVVYEVDRSWEKEGDTAWEVIDLLRTEDWHNPGGFTLSKVALRVLGEAGKVDQSIRHALTRTIGTTVRAEGSYRR